MTFFRLFLALIFISLTAYTAITITNHGWGLLAIFFGDMMAMTWPGQFNFDFFGFLLLSGLWVSWRHHFHGRGLLLGLIAVFGGVLFLSVYLLFLTYKAKGDMAKILLGETRASAR